MSVSQRLVFGVHSFTPYSRTTGLPYGTIKVLKSSSLGLSGTLVELMGGSSKFSWAAETGPISAELNLKGSQYEDFMFTLFLGAAPSAGTTEATGNVTVLTNVLNSSVKASTTGIASVAAKSGSEGDLKFGKYVVLAVSATTVDVYMLSDADIGRGTDGTIQDNLNKITATPLTITTSAVHTTIPGFGIDLIGGSGTIGMTTGDTASFMVRPENTGSSVVNIGGIATSFPEFGALVVAQKRGNQELTEIDCYRCIANGMPINFDQNAWSEYDIKIKLMHDNAQDAVFGFRSVNPSNT